MALYTTLMAESLTKVSGRTTHSMARVSCTMKTQSRFKGNMISGHLISAIMMSAGYRMTAGLRTMRSLGLGNFC